jgi:hypothetical protein
MVISPLVRGMLGLAASDGGRTLRFAPQLPANWEHVNVRNVAAGAARYDLNLGRDNERMTISVTSHTTTPAAAARLIIAPAFPSDAQVRSVRVNNRAAKFAVTREGEAQRVTVAIDNAARQWQIVFAYTEGTDVYVAPAPLVAGAASHGLHIIRARADEQALRLVLEGLSSRTYTLGVRTPHRFGTLPTGVTLQQGRSTTSASFNQQLIIRFDTAGEVGKVPITAHFP